MLVHTFRRPKAEPVGGVQWGNGESSVESEDTELDGERLGDFPQRGEKGKKVEGDSKSGDSSSSWRRVLAGVNVDG